MASLFSVFLALMPLMTLQAGIIQQSCSNGESACSAKANSLLQVQQGTAHKVVMADPGDVSEVAMTNGDQNEKEEEESEEKVQKTHTTNEQEPEEKGAIPGEIGEQDNVGEQEQPTQNWNEEEPERKVVIPGDNIEQVERDEKEQEMQRQDEEGPEGPERELEGEGSDFYDEEGEGSNQDNNEVEGRLGNEVEEHLRHRGHLRPTSKPIPFHEEDNYVCYDYGKLFSTAAEAEGYFHNECVHEYQYTKALCNELSEKVFEKFVEDKDATWKPDSDVCVEINALLRADKARRHEQGLNPVVASPPNLELLQRSKRSHSGKSATTLDETNVLKAPVHNQAPYQR